MLAYSPYDHLPAGGRPPRPAGDRRRPRPARDGARAREVGGRAARVGPGVVAALSLPRRDRGRRARRAVRVAPGISATRPRSMPGCSTGWECRMSESLHDEVIRVARDLIRLDTTNAREPGLGNETLCAEYLADYLSGYGVECELVAREAHRANLVARIPRGLDRLDRRGAARPTRGRLDRRGRRRVAGVRRAHRRRAVRPARLDPPAVRGRARRRGLAVGPRRDRHEERGGGPRGRDGRAGDGAASARAATCG